MRFCVNGCWLDPYVGFLHQDRPGRASLALDLLEEFRSPWADRFVLTLFNRKQLQNDFVFEASGTVKLTDDARKKMLVAFQAQTRRNHAPLLEEKVPMACYHIVRQLLARHLRGDMAFIHHI